MEDHDEIEPDHSEIENDDDHVEIDWEEPGDDDGLEAASEAALTAAVDSFVAHEGDAWHREQAVAAAEKLFYFNVFDDREDVSVAMQDVVRALTAVLPEAPPPPPPPPYRRLRKSR